VAPIPVVPSLKFHAHEVIAPSGSADAVPSKVTSSGDEALGWVTKDATGSCEEGPLVVISPAEVSRSLGVVIARMSGSMNSVKVIRIQVSATVATQGARTTPSGDARISTSGQHGGVEKLRHLAVPLHGLLKERQCVRANNLD
jgi:hypothetical protein